MVSIVLNPMQPPRAGSRIAEDRRFRLALMKYLEAPIDGIPLRGQLGGATWR